MAERFYDGMKGPEIRRELNDVYDFMADSMVSPTSSTSLTVGTGEKTLTVEENKALGIGQSVRIARTSDPLTWMDGVVTSYVGTTLKVLVTDADGSGTYSDWTVTLSGAAGPAGDGGWSPVLAVVSDGARRVFEVTDWVGGQGQKPGLGYIGAAGIVPNIGSAIDVRGAVGQTGPANSLSIGTVQSGAADASITGNAPTQTLNLTLPKGDTGDDGWSPIILLESDGDRRVLKIDDWTGGAGTKPGTGYIGSSGIVQDKANAVDVRGSIGLTGPANSLTIGTVQGGASAGATITGAAPTQTLNLTLPKGDAGDDGWAPVLAGEVDDERRVLKVADWTGGSGTKPGTGYIGASGLTPTIGSAIDVRGAPGAGAVSKVNNISPDGSGNVELDTDDIAEGSNNKYFAPSGDTSQYLRGDGSLASFPAIPPGTVTSVALSVPTGFSVDNSPVTNSGTISVTFSAGYELPKTSDIADWNTAYGWGNHASAGYATQTWVGLQGFVTTDTTYLAGTLNQLNTGSDTTTRVYTPQILAQWLSNKGYLTSHQQIKTLASQTLTGSGDVTLGDIGAAADADVLKKASNLSDLNNAATALGNLGGTTVGQALFTATNPSAIRYVKINADNSVTFRTAAELLADIGAFATPSGTTSQYVRGDGSVAAFPTVPSADSKADIADGSGTGFISPANLAALADDPQVISGGASNTFNWSAGVNYTMSLTGNRTLSNPTNVQKGTYRVIEVVSSNATQRTLSFGGNFAGDLPEVKVTNAAGMILYMYAARSGKIYVRGDPF